MIRQLVHRLAGAYTGRKYSELHKHDFRLRPRNSWLPKASNPRRAWVLGVDLWGFLSSLRTGKGRGLTAFSLLQDSEWCFRVFSICPFEATPWVYIVTTAEENPKATPSSRSPRALKASEVLQSECAFAGVALGFDGENGDSEY